LYYRDSAQKTNVMPLLDGGKSLTKCAFVSIQYQSDGRTDLFAITISRSACIMLTRGSKFDAVLLNALYDLYKAFD